jgi:anti-sigma B factor antagonist
VTKVEQQPSPRDVIQVGGVAVATSSQRRARAAASRPPDLGPVAFDVHVERDGARYEVALTGELDLATAPMLRDHLSGVADDGGGQVLIDLSQLAFIDSTGLSVLVMSCKRLRAGGGDLVLKAPTPAVAKVLEIAGVTQVFAVL